jgi:hypothetical protein
VQIDNGTDGAFHLIAEHVNDSVRVGWKKYEVRSFASVDNT